MNRWWVALAMLCPGFLFADSGTDVRLPTAASANPVAQTQILARSKSNLPIGRLATEKHEHLKLLERPGYHWMIGAARKTAEGRPAGPWDAAPLDSEPGPYAITVTEREDARLIQLALTNARKKKIIWESYHATGPQSRLEMISIAPDGSFLLSFEMRVSDDRSGYKVTWHSLKRPGEVRFLSGMPLHQTVISPDSQYILIDGLRLIHVPTWTYFDLEDAVLRKPFYLAAEDFLGWNETGRTVVFRVIYTNEEDPRWEEKWRVDLK